MTRGHNGWHPHLHEIVFTSRPLTDLQRSAWEAALAKLWIRATIDSGLAAPTMQHGIRIQSGHSAASYIAKWGVADEMVGSAKKGGRDAAAGLTPWELLDNAAQRNDHGAQCARWWIEYARVFRGRRQLVWSRGLRALLESAPEQSDLDLAELDPEHRELVCVVDHWSWVAIRRLRSHAAILAVASRDVGAMEAAMARLRTACVLSSGRTCQENWLEDRNCEVYSHGN